MIRSGFWACVAIWYQYVWLSNPMHYLVLDLVSVYLLTSFRHTSLPSDICSGLPPVPLELQWPGRCSGGGCKLWWTRHPLRLYLAWHRAHGWQALLHLGSTQIFITKGNAAGPQGQKAQGTRRPKSHCLQILTYTVLYFQIVCLAFPFLWTQYFSNALTEILQI